MNQDLNLIVKLNQLLFALYIVHQALYILHELNNLFSNIKKKGPNLMEYLSILNILVYNRCIIDAKFIFFF